MVVNVEAVMPPHYTNYVSCVKKHETFLAIFISRLLDRSVGGGVLEHLEEVSHRVVRLDGVTEWGIDDDRVIVAPALALAGQVASVDEIRHDGLGRPLGDPHLGGDVSSADRRVSIDAHEHVGVVAQEGPLTSTALLRLLAIRHGRSPS